MTMTTSSALERDVRRLASGSIDAQFLPWLLSRYADALASEAGREAAGGADASGEALRQQFAVEPAGRDLVEALVSAGRYAACLDAGERDRFLGLYVAFMGSRAPRRAG